MSPLHFLRPISLTAIVFMLLIGMKFAMPDSPKVMANAADPFSKIAFFSRQGESEVLHVIDPLTKKEDTFSFSGISSGYPVWSPRCDRIALDQSQNNQQVVNVIAYSADGLSSIIPPGGPTTITAHFPSWSPDGTSFAFEGIDTEDPKGDVEIYTLSMLDGSMTNLTNNPEYDVYANWSPDGKQIVFSSITTENNPERNFDIYMVNADGSSMKAIYIDPEMDDVGPSWSPDGNSIVFVAYNKSTNTSHFLLTDKNSSTVTQLTDRETYTIIDYVWSNDGKYIAFSSINADDDSQIFLLDITGKSVKPLTDVPKTINKYASWSPDDSQLVFNSNRDGDFEIYTLNVTTRGINQLTDNDYDDVYPIWSPKSCFEN